MDVLISEAAKQDLEEAACYIASDNPAAAVRVLAAARDAFDHLELLPHLGRIREFQNPLIRDIRILPLTEYPNYLIVYRVRERVEILRILHGAQDIDRELGRLS